MGYSPWGLKESDSTEQLNYSVLGPQKFLKVAGTKRGGGGWHQAPGCPRTWHSDSRWTPSLRPPRSPWSGPWQ